MRQQKRFVPLPDTGQLAREARNPVRHQMHHLALALDAAMDRDHARRKDHPAELLEHLLPDDDIGDLRRQGWCVGRKRVRRLMRKIGLSPIYQAPKTSEPHPQHRIHPYLLRHLAIERPDQVWCADVTYIPMRRGFLYLVAIMDWFSRKVLAWRLSNTMDADFCVAALEEAIARHGKPDIFNTDQGSQFTSFAFTTTLKDAGIRISMDGRGRWMDNVFIERLWRSLKYECVFLSAFETGSEARSGIGSWIDYYNRRRPHSTFSGRTPDEVYATAEMTERLAA